jgi:hypothetical protein
MVVYYSLLNVIMAFMGKKRVRLVSPIDAVETGL